MTSSTSSSTPTSQRADLGFLRCQHIAESESEVEILPSFSSPPLRFLQHTLGPFRPNYPITVPLWLALSLRQSQRCSIVPPAWLTPDFLLLHCEREAGDMSVFFPQLPFHYIEIAYLLCHQARDDIPMVERVEELLRDVQELRRQKIDSGLLGWSSAQPTTVRLNGVAAMEVESIREMAGCVLKQFYSMQRGVTAAAAGGGGGGGGWVAGGQRQQQPQQAARGAGSQSSSASASSPSDTARRRGGQGDAADSTPRRGDSSDAPSRSLRRYR